MPELDAAFAALDLAGLSAVALQRATELSAYAAVRNVRRRDGMLRPTVAMPQPLVPVPGKSRRIRTSTT